MVRVKIISAKLCDPRRQFNGVKCYNLVTSNAVLSLFCPSHKQTRDIIAQAIA